MRVIKLMVFLSFFSCSTNQNTHDQSPIDYVNPYMGNISHLLVPTFPTVHLPNSMLRMIPNRKDFTGDKISGLAVISTSHRGVSAFTFSPIVNPGNNLKAVYSYSYDNEIVRPHYYEVFLDDNQIKVSYAVSHQSAIYNLEFLKPGEKNLMVNNTSGAIEVGDNYITGYQDISKRYSKGSSKVYLYAEFNTTIISSGILIDGAISEKRKTKGKKIGAAIKFDSQAQNIKVKYGISFISAEQAKLNLFREIPGYDMAKLIQKGKNEWNQVLSKTQVQGGKEDHKTVFYTSLYRTYERPVCISEDGRYYSSYDGKVHDDEGKPFYVDDWIWDTYRATHPYRVLTEKKMELDIIHSYIRMAEQMDHFWMPTFPEINGDSRRMNSNHGVATVLDAYVKNLTNFDLDKAYQASKAAITEKTLAPWSSLPAGELDKFYADSGYIPALKEGEKETIQEVNSKEMRQPVAVTLGTVYDEWCLANIAKILGKQDDYDYFIARALNYRTLYNAKTGFFHPKDKNGQFIEPFDYRFSGGAGARMYYSENNAWVYRWDVPHNIADLVELMGGPKKFIKNLESTFNEDLGRKKYQFYSQLPDHTGNVGQFSMANEPSLHIPYLYNYAGQPWKTQKRIKALIDQWFRNDLMGLPGDEDGGGMSAFVVFSMLGFYPVTPGLPVYNIGSPFFEKSVINLGDNKKFIIIANKLSKENKYIQSAKLNGKEWNKPWFRHDEIEKGGVLELEMGNIANKSWGSDTINVPPSFKLEN